MSSATGSPWCPRTHFPVPSPCRRRLASALAEAHRGVGPVVRPIEENDGPF
jgi:hypothetical protein